MQEYSVQSKPGDMPVPKWEFDTKGMPMAQAFSVWQENVGVFYGVRLLNNAAERFHSQVEAFQLSETILANYKCVAQTFDRTRSRIGRDGLDHLSLQFCLEGGYGRRGGGTDEKAEPGDLIIADLAQPYAVDTSDFRSLSFMMPRRLLAPLLNRPDEQNMRVISGKTPLVTLLREHLLEVIKAAPAMNRQEAEAIMGPTMQLAAAAINGAVTADKTMSVEIALASQIRRYIGERIADNGITAENVANLFGISVRKLYYLFEPYGGFSSYVVEEKLRRCRDELISPQHRRESIADIAERYGFTHRKSFVRAFRRIFEISPREMRELAKEGHGLPLESMNGADMWHWIREMR